jgi:hypothetical protein
VRKSISISIIFTFVLTACATPKHNYQAATTNISEPPLNSINTKQVGDEMLKQGKFREHDALYVTSQLKPHWAYTVFPGYYLKSGEDESNEHYRIGGAGEESGYIEKAALADSYKSLLLKKDTGVLCVVTVFNATACFNNITDGFEKVKKPITTQDTIQRTLIYSGKSGNKINVGYREFSGNIARPAFSNNVEYDLEESKQIGYKGALLEIIEATNTFIKYKVLSNFNNAAQ